MIKQRLPTCAYIVPIKLGVGLVLLFRFGPLRSSDAKRKSHSLSRRQGPDVWEYRWRESCSGQTRKHRRIVIGTLNTLKDESAALKAIAALRKDININDRRMKTKPLRLAELVEHYSPHECAGARGRLPHAYAQV